ncbi:hypothetical protein [Natronococcus occultus]|uniref:Uncharacterized protein n=1 Tax=Natronococcus occultus SP4 TaxID=694430 RepID=L0JY20_9EURY|nr:hypothetical protein [Natronococcus occultus]AGB37932.1 hypothetical protein Natoc_2148 [Natronococcus occultus SP4]
MGSDDCQMRGCPREAERTMTFRRYEDVAVCERHYRRNVAIKYGVLLALSVVLAGLGLGAYWLIA